MLKLNNPNYVEMYKGEVNQKFTPILTIGGNGTRLKGIFYGDKQNLYWGKYTIHEWIKSIFPELECIGYKKTKSRKETLQQLVENKLYENILIIDCDIIPIGIDFTNINFENNLIWYFKTTKRKYGSLIFDQNNKLKQVSEQENISEYKSSGVYFIKNLKKSLQLMNDENSIAEMIIGADSIYEDTFIRMGDIEDYYESIKIKRLYDNCL